MGSVVRVPLKGRRVRGWVVSVGGDPDVPDGRLQPVAGVSSEGPPEELVELARWAAWRWAGPLVTFLRLCTPANVVRPERARPPRAGRQGTPARGPAPDGDISSLAAEAAASRRAVVQWPPATRMAELLRGLVSADGSTVVVFPDQRRSNRFVEHVRRSGAVVVDYRADRSRAARTESWERALAGGCVVVGGRGAIWAPVPDLAAVLVVDDGDESHKDERSPTWHARDVALERARRVDARVTLVGPSPTLEARATAPGVIRPPRDVEREGWGRLVVLDRRDEPPGSGVLSDRLPEALHSAPLGLPLVFVLNRRGRARLLACGACRALVRCDACGAAMSEDDDGLVCGACSCARPRVCAECASTVLRRVRPGIGRVAEELAALLPHRRVATVEGASDGLPEGDAFVGTEAVLHRVERAAAVVFLDFDQELLAPRFRAPEQALWLLVRAVRIAGDRGAGARVVVQTRAPEHEAVLAAAGAEPGTLAAAELERRAPLGFPPFGAVAEVRGAPQGVHAFLGVVDGTPDVEFLGPVDAGSGRETVLVKAPTVDALCDALARWRTSPERARAPGNVRVDVDPARA